MTSRSYPRSSVEEKWQRAFGGRSVSVSAADLADASHLRFVLPWIANSDEPRDPSTLRRLVASDVYARHLRLTGKSPFFAHAIDGFADGSTGADWQRLVDEWDEVKRALGIGDDATATVCTADPLVYRFAQWAFLLAYREELVFRRTRRVRAAGGRVHEFREWCIDLLPYGERLFADVDKSSWSAEARKQQKALIGRRRGTEVIFPVTRLYDTEWEQLPVFTARVEAIYGATFLLISPRHELLDRLTWPEYAEDVEAYLDRLRTGEARRVSGERIGAIALHPISFERIPVVVSPLADTPYSQGVRLGIPAHDAEQFELARALRLPIREVIHSSECRFDDRGRLVAPALADGVLTNSGPYSSAGTRSGRERIISHLAKRSMCRKTTRYATQELRASTESRVNGPPVPLIHCDACGVVPVPFTDLPVELPPSVSGGAAEEFPAGSIARLDEDEVFLTTTCPTCGRAAKRDAGTLLPWIGQALSYLHLPCPELSRPEAGPRDPDPTPGRPRRRRRDEDAEDDGGVSTGAAESAEDADEPIASAVAMPTDEDSREAPPSGAATSGAELAEGDAPGASEGDEPGEVAEAVGGDPAVAGDSSFASPSGEEAAPVSSTTERPRGRPTTPFTGDFLHRLLPADVALAPRRVTPRDIVSTRFVTKLLFDLRLVPVFEPFRRFFRVGGVALASPSDRERARLTAAGRPIPAECDIPDVHREILDRFGADAYRLALIAAGPVDRRVSLRVEDVYPWKKFVDRVWREVVLRAEKGRFVSRNVLEKKHRAIYRVTDRLRRFKFHTALGAISEFVRVMTSPAVSVEEIDKTALESFTILLSPFAPFLAQELWEHLGHESPIHEATWPSYSSEIVHPSDVEMTVWIDGKVVDKMVQPSEIPESMMESMALGLPRVKELLAGHVPSRTITVPGRLVSFTI